MQHPHLCPLLHRHNLHDFAGGPEDGQSVGNKVLKALFAF